MATWHPSQQISALQAVMGPESHRSVTAAISVDFATTPPALTEAERTLRRCARIRSVPCVYLKCPPERKRNERFAMAALLGLDHHTHRREEVLAMVNLHCPHLFQNPAAMRELFQHGNAPGIEHILMRMYTRITWNLDLALVALDRSMDMYRYFPGSIQVHDDIVKKLLTDRFGVVCLGRFAPRSFLSANVDLILQVLNRGFRTIDIPLELRRDKEFVLKALAVNPFILSDCPMEIISDHGILLAVASLDDPNPISYLETAIKKFHSNPKKVLVPFAEDVKTKLDNHASFYTLLQGISVSGRPGSESPLQFLHCGDETSAALKRDIAAFLGAPTQSSDVRILKKAWETSVFSYHDANVKGKSAKHGTDSDEVARANERKYSRQRRMGRHFLVIVRRDISNGRVDANGRRDYRRILNQVQMAIDVDEENIRGMRVDLLDSDSEFESDLEEQEE